MYWLALLIITFADSREVAIERALTLTPIPGANGVYLQNPRGVSFDARGRFYILDLKANTVFVWDKFGGYLTNFGKKGEGPGEFVFESKNGAQGFISAFQDRIYIYDGAKNYLHEFDANYHFISSKKLVGHGGRTNYFSMTQARQILLWQQNPVKQEPTQELSLYDLEMNRIKTVYHAKDPIFEAKYQGKKLIEMTIHAYTPSVTMFCDPSSDEVIVGMTDVSEFAIYSSKGEKKETIRFKPQNNTLTQSDIDEFEMLPSIKQSRDLFKIVYPNQKPHYQAVVPIENDRFLVYSKTPFTNEVQGLLINRKGETLGKFHFLCGENGGLFASHGRLIAIQTDELGDFTIQELVLE